MVLRRITRIVHVAHYLIHPQARFLEAGQHSRVRLIPALCHTQQREGGSRDDQENRRSNQQLQKREAALRSRHCQSRARHFSTVVSSVSGRTNPLPPVCLAPSKNRLPVTRDPCT